MKLRLLLFFCFIILSRFDCYREGKNCHPAIIIKNNSTDTVIFALESYYNNLCNLGKVEELLPGIETELRQYTQCWEKALSNGSTQEIYFVDPAKFNNPNVFYSCDSIEFKNNIFKLYVLTLDDLKKSNFTVTYP